MGRFTNKEVLYSTSNVRDDTAKLLSGNLNIQANGHLYSATSQNCFYLFVPVYYFSGYRFGIKSSDSNIAFTITGEQGYISISEKLEYKELGTFEWSEGGGAVIGDDRYYMHYGFNTYKVNIAENETFSSREGTITVDFKYGEEQGYYSQPSEHNGTASITLLQDGKEQHITPTEGIGIYYKVTKEFTAVTLDAMQQIISAPLQLSDTYSQYSYNDINNPNINTFQFLYLRNVNSGYTNFTSYSTQPSWVRLSEVEGSFPEGYHVYQIEVDENPNIDEHTLSYSRSAHIEIRSRGIGVIIVISIVQYGTGSVVIQGDVSDFEEKYWEEDASTTVSIIDTNNGAAIDSTSLLFKSNFANIYNTIEQKDSTLFLGNYESNQNINRIHEQINKQKDAIDITEAIRKVYVDSIVSQNYPYTPNMKQNSQEKRMFKPGETYALGLVFVDKTGTWSSVYYLDNWSVSREKEPYLDIDDNGKQYYAKPVEVVQLPKEVTATLSFLDIVAVIPVYAVKHSNTIVCQGFLSPSMQNSSRLTAESIDSQYSWFYRDKFTLDADETLDSGVLFTGNKEIQNLDAAINNVQDVNMWIINRQICTLNTPEVECSEYLSNAMLQNTSCVSIRNYTGFSYTNNIALQVNGKYIKSYFSAAHAYSSNNNPVSVTSIKNRRYTSGYIWNGFVDNSSIARDDLISESTDSNNYEWYAVYPWQRSTIGGEGPSSIITNKILFNSLYNDGLSFDTHTMLTLPDVIDAAIYRDFDTASIIKIENSVYQGNTDYIAVTEADSAYKAWTEQGHYPTAPSDVGVYAGYDTNGNITDPISIKYKTAPHIVLKFNNKVTYDNSNTALFCVELYNPNITLKTDVQDLQGYQWIKCGDLKRIKEGEDTIVIFEEGDYFFGRYDSLRTYQYAENDVNSVIEIVSGMLCSRVNLDSRCDKNRGVTTPTVSPTNFNIFNPVYNQLNNYFTFNYINLDDLTYKRRYSNSIQWSLTKEYSSDIDNWCNIQDINTLDFDGDKGQITSIERLGNELIVFQDTAISQIQYNEKTQIATEQGVPIEIGNSGKVDGKYYLYNHIGCQYKGAISKSSSGIYFVDGINKSLYKLGVDNKITDLCTAGGMKSWGLANLDSNWWSYYDINSQEILFSNDIETLAFSDSYGKFNSFVGYGGIRWNFRANDYTIQICPINFKQVLATGTETLFSNKRIPISIVNLNNDEITFWKKNSIDETKFFENYSPIEIQLQVNPEPTKDKIFSTIEYRMDCFGEHGVYLPDTTFDIFRAWDEYQDTQLRNLRYIEGNETGPIYNQIYSTKLRKKFRIWRLDIPRAIDIVTDDNSQVDNNSTGNVTRKYYGDRIRNPWCNIYLYMDTSKAKKIIFNDLAVQYFK